MARGQMQDVVLVEVADLDREGRKRVPARESARLRRSWPLAAVLVALLAVGGGIAELLARDRAARLAALPGVLAPLDRSMRVLWSEPLGGWAAPVAVGGDLLVFGADAQGATAVASLEATTGRRRWETPLPEVSAPGDVWCTALDDASAGDAGHVLCRLAGVPPAAVAAAASAVDASGDSTRLLVLDAGTGRRVAERDLPSATVSVVPFGRDVVVTEVLADSRAQVERQDPVTGEVRWSFRSTDPLKTPASGPVWLFPLVQHGVIVANGPVTWAFSADGRMLGEWHLQGGDWAVRGGWGLDVSVLADGRFAVGESGGVGLSDQDYGTVARTDARDGFSIPGPVLEPVADDGSASGVLFLRPTGIGGMVAMDPTSGRLLWKAGVQPWGDALVLDGRLIVVNGRDLSAIDARSGQVLWTTRVAMGNHEQRVLTDGRSVFVPRFDAVLGAVLTAFDPSDGREQWTARLPAGASRLAVVHGHLVAMTAQELVALG